MILSAYARARDFVPEAVYTGDLKFIPTQLGIPTLVTMSQAGKCATKPARFWEVITHLEGVTKVAYYPLWFVLVVSVLQIQVYPKINAPGVSKPQRVAKSDFLLILKIFLALDDIRPGN